MVRRRKPAGGFRNSGNTSQAARRSVQSPEGARNNGIPHDEEDLFFENRDKILLDGSDPVKGKNLEDYHDEEEVFALKGIGESDSDAGSYDDSEDVDEGDEEDDEEPERTVRTKSSKKTKRRGQDDVPAEEESAASASDEDVEERWGKNKFAYYSATAQEVESDDEEARELEEAEALRLQAKAREAITDDDFGLNDSRLFQTPTLDTASTQSVPGPSTTVPLVTAPRDKKSILRQLELSSPEVLALAREWGHVAAVMRKLEVAIAKRTALIPNHLSLGMVHLHYQTFLTYATVLSHYLYVRSTPVPGPTPNAPSTAKAVPEKVLERLCQLRRGLSVLEDIGFSALEGLEDDDDFEESELESEDEADLEWDGAPDAKRFYVNLDDIDAIIDDIETRGDNEAKLNDLRRMLNEAVNGNPLATANLQVKAAGKNGKIKPKLKIPAKTKKKEKKPEGGAANASETVKETNGLPIKFDLEEPEFGFYSAQASSSLAGSRLPLAGAPDDAFGEQTSLDFVDLAEKNARKKSLKFHTQKLENTFRRREAARLNMLGGDDDIPRRNIRREKKEREKAALEAAKRGERAQGGDDLDDVDPEPPASTSAETGVTPGTTGATGDKGKKRTRGEMEDSDGDANSGKRDYELVEKSNKQAKIDKKAAYEARVAANKPDFSEGPITGSRSITRAILKNKGLTPKRGKAVRNPRVKKKLRFEEAKRKVSSKRAVFKGGLASLPGGRYEGEKSGISKVVKSVKL